MQIELLIVPDCPSAGPTATLLRIILADLGLATATVRTTVVTDEAQAERLGFLGSPSILIDGRDPFGDPDRRRALACRLYDTAAGRAGVPDPDQLRQVVRQAADSPTA